MDSGDEAAVATVAPAKRSWGRLLSLPLAKPAQLAAALLPAYRQTEDGEKAGQLTWSALADALAVAVTSLERAAEGPGLKGQLASLMLEGYADAATLHTAIAKERSAQGSSHLRAAFAVAARLLKPKTLKAGKTEETEKTEENEKTEDQYGPERFRIHSWNSDPLTPTLQPVGLAETEDSVAYTPREIPGASVAGPLREQDDGSSSDVRKLSSTQLPSEWEYGMYSTAPQASAGSPSPRARVVSPRRSAPLSASSPLSKSSPLAASRFPASSPHPRVQPPVATSASRARLESSVSPGIQSRNLPYPNTPPYPPAAWNETPTRTSTPSLRTPYATPQRLPLGQLPLRSATPRTSPGLRPSYPPTYKYV